MDDSALGGVVVPHSIIFICYDFTAPISGGSYGGFALAPADDFNAAMIYRYEMSSFQLRLNMAQFSGIMVAIEYGKDKNTDPVGSPGAVHCQ